MPTSLPFARAAPVTRTAAPNEAFKATQIEEVNEVRVGDEFCVLEQQPSAINQCGFYVLTRGS